MRTGLILSVLLAALGCKGKAAPGEDAAVGANASPGASASAGSGGRPHLVRDQEGHLVPNRPRPEDDSALVPASPKGVPTWDLDRKEPARDYVERYVRATKRYGDRAACVTIRAAGSREGKALVEVRDRESPPPGCPAAGGAPRDVFLVDVDGDRLELAKPGGGGGAALAKWPDGTEPGGPAGAAIEGDAPPAKLGAALIAAKLTPVRTQLYGRGSYVVITLAGWREPIARNTPPESLGGLVEAMCAASDGLPFGLFAGIERATILRIRCGDSAGARWEQL